MVPTNLIVIIGQDMASRAQSAKPDARSNAMVSSKSTRTFGVSGYLMHKCGLLKREPKYTLPKDGDKNKG